MEQGGRGDLELHKAARMKMLVIDAICGVGFPTQPLAVAVEQQGMAIFTGSKGAPSWEWNRNALAKVRDEQLQELYEALCEARESADAPPPEQPAPHIFTGVERRAN